MDEINNIIESIRELFNKNTGYKISKGSDVPYQTVQDLKNGKSSIEDARFKTIIKLYNYQKGIDEMNKLTYVVDMHKQDKALEIITKEGESFYLYEISPQWFDKADYILELIKDEDLSLHFDGEEIEEPTQFDYTIQEVKDELNNL